MQVTENAVGQRSFHVELLHVLNVSAWVRSVVGQRSFLVELLHVLGVSARVLVGFSDLIPQFQNIHVRQIGNSKLSMGVSASVNGC